jgi:hypothetical protein
MEASILKGVLHFRFEVAKRWRLILFKSACGAAWATPWLETALLQAPCKRAVVE